MKRNQFGFRGVLLMMLLFTCLLFSACGKGGGKSATTPTGTTTDSGTPPASGTTTPSGTAALPDTPASKDLIFGADFLPQIVQSSGAAANTRDQTLLLCGLLGEAFGTSLLPKNDSVAAAEGEILIGETSRPASAEAEALLAAYAGSETTGAYALLRSGNTLAVAANHEVALQFAIQHLASLINGNSLTFSAGYSEVKTFSLTEYFADLKAEERKKDKEKYEKRWDVLQGSKLSPEAIQALKDFDSVYGEDVIDWLASLWDPSTGAFYYSPSARDYKAFLPDVESTYQTLSFLRGTGMAKKLATDIPKEMQDKIVAFTKSLQDPDGFFYHPQWGKNIWVTRRGRDLMWSTSILSTFGARPKYIPANQTARAAEVRIPVMLAALPDHLSSEEKFLAYLMKLDVSHNSHSAGHELSSQTDQIISAGLMEVCLDYLDSIQRSDNGLWEEGENYSTLSGLFKIGCLYAAAKRPMHYTDKMIESGIKAMLSDENPSIIIYVYNPWAGISQALDVMRLAGTDGREGFNLSAAYQMIYDRLPELLAATRTKLDLFRKADGSYSYYQDRSDPLTQGTYVSLGVNEGDVNATGIGVNSIRNWIYTCLGLDVIPLYCSEQLDRFLDICAKQTAPVKKDAPLPASENFEDGMPARFANQQAGELCIVSDPEDASNHVLSMSTRSDAGDNVLFPIDNPSAATVCTVFGGKFRVAANTGAAYAYQISIGGAYMLTLHIRNGYVYVADTASTANTETSVSLGKAEENEWFTLRVEIYPGSASEFAVKVYVNGVCKAVSHNFFGSDTAGNVPGSIRSPITIYAMRMAEGSLLMDDLYFEHLTDHPFSDADVDTTPEPLTETLASSIDFESDTVGAKPAALTILRAGGSVSFKTGESPDQTNKYLQVVKSDENGKDGGCVALPLAEVLPHHEGTTVSVSFRVQFTEGTRFGTNIANRNNSVVSKFYFTVKGVNLYTPAFRFSLDEEKNPTGILIASNNAKDQTVNYPATAENPLAFGTWYTFTYEITFRNVEGEESADIRILLDGTEFATVEEVLSADLKAALTASPASLSLQFETLMRIHGGFCIDDVTYSATNAASE